MILSSIRRLLREDLAKGGKLPDWIDSLLQPLNEFIDQVTTGFRNNLTFTDNFAGKQFSLDFKHNIEIVINPGPTAKPVLGVIPLYFGGEALSTFQITRKQNGYIGVTFGFVSGIATPVECTIFILY